jgi:transcriptional regulator with GAF, ATPase, and Fis domain
MAHADPLQDQLENLFSEIELPEPTTAITEELQPFVERLPEDETARLQTLERQVALLQQANYQLQKRAIHLEASTAISRAAASILDPQELMQTTVDLIRSRFNFYHVSIFLLDPMPPCLSPARAGEPGTGRETGEWAVMRASTGEVGRQMAAQAYRLAVDGESMVGWVCAHRQARVALDVGADAVYLEHPLLPDTRSEMVLPLRVGERLLGALDVQSTEDAAFDDDDLRTLQAMADSIAFALENAWFFTTTRQSARRQHLVARMTDRLQGATTIDDILTLTLAELGETFDLAQASICLGTEAELLAVSRVERLAIGNGQDQE